MNALVNFEGAILLWIQNVLRTPILTTFFKFITALGDGGYLWLAIAAVLLIPKKTRRVGLMVFLSMGLSHLVNNMLLKKLVARTRPYELIAGLETLVKRPSSFSFPSGHSASSFAAAWVLFRRLPKKYGVPAVVLAAFIAFSRLYVGVHFPTDVLLGALSGALVSYAAVALYEAAEGVLARRRVS